LARAAAVDRAREFRRVDVVGRSVSVARRGGSARVTEVDPIAVHGNAFVGEELALVLTHRD